MEGHGRLPSAADVQGKSRPLPPALPPGPVRGAGGSSPSPVAVLAHFPKFLCLADAQEQQPQGDHI